MDDELDDKHSVSMASSDMGSAASFNRKHEAKKRKKGASVSCLDGLLGSVRTCWQSRDTDDMEQNNELYIKTTLRELVIYLLFLVILMILSFGSVSGLNYYFTKALKGVFDEAGFPNASSSNFASASTIEDFWTFVQGPLLDGLYWESNYNGLNLPDDQKNFILYESKLLGVPRMKQVKVKSDSCVIAADFQSDVKECYTEYSSSAEDREPFGDMNETAWVYTDSKTLGGQSISGILTSYPSGGYYVDLNNTREDTLAIINDLYNKLWITRGTRMVLIDFTVYNPNINLFCFIRLMMEFPPTGGALPLTEYRPVKLLRYVRPSDYFVLACECIFLLFVTYYSIEESLEISKHKFKYFKSIWNILDVVVLVMCAVCTAFNVFRTIAVQHKLEELLQNPLVYPDFDFLSYWQLQFERIVALLIFLAWVKLFKYISFNKTMTQLTSTLDKCSKDLMGFGVMFSIVFFAFAQLGYLLFGGQVENFKDFTTCLLTLFRIIVGDFDFDQLEAANRVLGPIYFIIYVFFVFFVLLNMFLAIINDTYAEVKDELSKQEDPFRMGDFFKARANFFMDKLHLKREKIMDIQEAMDSADLNNDDKVDFDELRVQLKNRGYADGEIEAIFARYDSDGNRTLDKDEQAKMQQELDQQKAAITVEMESQQQNAASAQIMNRMEELESHISALTNKLNQLADHFDTMQPSSSRSVTGPATNNPFPNQSALDGWTNDSESQYGSEATTSRISMGKWKTGKPK
jgi:polycystin 2